jgi:hypothetical protein
MQEIDCILMLLFSLFFFISKLLYLECICIDFIFMQDVNDEL